MNAILWKGSGWYAYKNAQRRFEKIRQDKVHAVRMRGTPVEFFSAPPLNWEVRTPNDEGTSELLIPDKDFKPDDEVRIMYCGASDRGMIVRRSSFPQNWIVAVQGGKGGRVHEEHVHEQFIHKIGKSEGVSK